jgi:hypothetical protein
MVSFIVFGIHAALMHYMPLHFDNKEDWIYWDKCPKCY